MKLILICCVGAAPESLAAMTCMKLYHCCSMTDNELNACWECAVCYNNNNSMSTREAVLTNPWDVISDHVILCIFSITVLLK